MWANAKRIALPPMGERGTLAGGRDHSVRRQHPEMRGVSSGHPHGPVSGVGTANMLGARQTPFRLGRAILAGFRDGDAGTVGASHRHGADHDQFVIPFVPTTWINSMSMIEITVSGSPVAYSSLPCWSCMR